jgi:predicted O-linked N-acetylglucosamine transferase (SPINDLY family)
VLASLLARDPNHRPALLAMAEALLAVEQREAANTHYRRALALQPDDENVQGRLCWSLLNSRYGDEAAHIGEAAAIARAMAARGDLRPGSAHAVQSALMRVADFAGLALFDQQFPDRRALLDYWVRRNTIGALHAQLGRVATPQDRYELIDCHIAWGDALQAKHVPLRPHRGTAHSKLRIGFMSSDLRHHPVSYFALPIFELYDRAQFDMFCYSFYPGTPDPVQSRIASLVDRFDTLHSLPDEAVAARIAADELDVLVELGGSTHLNRLEVMAFQPAPVQVSWLGYPHSAGLSRIGHIVVDPHIRPEDPRLLSEKPLELPASWVCLGRLGFADQPILPGTAEERSGILTFGTMNNPYKYTPFCIAAWARVLQGVPESRFMFVRPESGVPAFRDFIAAHFAAHNIARDRLVFRAVRGDHMRHYNDIDISLDTLPQTGGTTTCECLWMGVPVVSLTGAAFFERLSTSNLINAGLGEFAVENTNDYVACAIALARDAQRRAALRAALRSQIKVSALGDQPGWVRDFLNNIRAVA